MNQTPTSKKDGIAVLLPIDRNDILLNEIATSLCPQWHLSCCHRIYELRDC